VLSTAVDWVGAVLLGQAATSLAIMAVASIGFLTLSGRLPARRGAGVILGCFVIFSAGGIASGLLSAASRSGGRESIAAAAPPAAYVPTVPKAAPYDPYSGAAVPDQSSEDLLN
jgi:hypothetical protein